MIFCPHCGAETRGSAATCQRSDCPGKARSALPPAPRRLTPDEIQEFAWLLGQVRGRPFHIGMRHWELLDASGAVVLRVEASDSRNLARFFAVAPEMISRLIEHAQAQSTA